MTELLLNGARAENGVSLFMFSLFILSGLGVISWCFVVINAKNRFIRKRLKGLEKVSQTQKPETGGQAHSALIKNKTPIFEKRQILAKPVGSVRILGAGLMVVIMVSIAVKFPFITGLSLLAAMTIGGAWFGARIYMRQRKKQRFTTQLIEAIDILIRGARVGISIQESFQIIAREMPSPIGVEFKTLAEKMSIGIDLESALKEASMQKGIKEFQFLATTLILQRQSGGQYAEVLENLNRVLRDRQAQLMKARAVTSEARLSAKIIAGVTVIILCILALTNRQQFHFLLNDPSGHSILGYGFVSTLFGFFLISRILRTMK